MKISPVDKMGTCEYKKWENCQTSRQNGKRRNGNELRRYQADKLYQAYI